MSKFRAWFTVCLAAGTLLLSSCSHSAEPQGDSSPKTGTQTSQSADFSPVTIKHALGTAEIKKQPERVVTLGQGAAETAIALGHTPVGMESYPWGADETGYLPWIHEAVQDKGDELPELITGGTELDIEAVAALKPDVILAPWSGITEEQYSLLADIAPTVAYPEEPWVITWEQEIEMVAKALGEENRSQELIDEVNSTFAKYAKPEYKDYTFAYIYTDGPGTLGVFFEGEQRSSFLSKLGLTIDPVVETFRDQEVPGTDSALIGLENADKLKDTDVIVTWYSSSESRKETEGQKLYMEIPAIKRGAVVAAEDQSFVTASSIINPLTVPWAAERYIPLIDAAVKAAK
ncbi:MAG: iron-siderophore ABC transporter substrate-binding protein [Bowdeniella nasicola]|nr:iron-siderophore ABC transporter substrate-binding protein [Bowdeniella nasicola]